MLLINGELLRKYHFTQHAAHLHTRGHEQQYYTSKAELRGLSMCSVDGLNYEIRQIEKGFKKIVVRDLNSLAFLAWNSLTYAVFKRLLLAR